MASEEEDFRPLEGMAGRLYVPRPRGARKHPCPECFECQWCADARCAACRGWCGRCRGEGEPGSGPGREG